jgi:hypothetical protein
MRICRSGKSRSHAHLHLPIIILLCANFVQNLLRNVGGIAFTRNCERTDGLCPSAQFLPMGKNRPQKSSTYRQLYFKYMYWCGGIKSALTIIKICHVVLELSYHKLDQSSNSLSHYDINMHIICP